ncbi:MAG: GNAT family N-acetyltransferase [Planctomycetota bacterium]|nr:MAG: GNAT family N-acetyltransferase [Planctomycetota bacterium]
MLIRQIQPADDREVGKVIREVMTEFGAIGPGYSIEDPEVDAMSAVGEDARSVFYVVVDGPEIVGCGGIAPLKGGDRAVCELQKMYFLPEARGKGVGRILAETLLVDAARLGYHAVYIETLEHMVAARRLYERLGFQRLPGPWGGTGHDACDCHYALEISPPAEIRFES